MVQKVTAAETAIQKSFTQLLAQQPFEKISVRAIAQTAHINRGTFYLHYVDKYALLAHLEGLILEPLQQYLTHDFTDTMTYQRLDTDALRIYPVVTEIMQLIDAEFDLCRVLLGPYGDPKFEQRLKQLIQTAIQRGLQNLKGQPQLSTLIPENYAWELVTAGLFSVIHVWLQEPQPQSAQAVAEIVMKTRFLTPYDLLGLPTKKASNPAQS